MYLVRYGKALGDERTILVRDGEARILTRDQIRIFTHKVGLSTVHESLLTHDERNLVHDAWEGRYENPGCGARRTR